MQNLTSYSCSPTPISYRGDEISRVSRVVSEIWRGTDRQTDAATKTEGSHTKCASLIKSRNAWQSLAWSPRVRAVILANTWNKTEYWLSHSHKANYWLPVAPLSERSCTSRTADRRGVYADDPRKLRGIGPILTKFAHDIARSSPLNLLKSALRYSNLFWNAEVMNEGESADFAHFDRKIGCHSNVPWAIGKRVISVIYRQIPTYDKNLVNIGPLDAEIICQKVHF